jgi:hypothetical protein
MTFCPTILIPSYVITGPPPTIAADRLASAVITAVARPGIAFAAPMVLAGHRIAPTAAMVTAWGSMPVCTGPWVAARGQAVAAAVAIAAAAAAADSHGG